MNKGFIYFLSLALLATISRAQTGNLPLNTPTIIPPSPDVAALARYSDIPVSYSTGVPDISIPIYTLKAGKLSMPINISYHASGIRVRDIASTVGLGWVLNAGGMVSRTVLGKQDENNTYISPYKSTNDIINARAAVANDNDARDLIYHLQNMSKQNFETQSDRYSYNFNGKSGTFRYDWLNGNIHLIPYAPLKIEKQYINNNTSAPQNSMYFSIKDERGDEYIFKAREVSSQNGLQPISGWNLTKVISADHNDEINLFYSTGESIVEVAENCMVTAGNGNGQAGYGANNVPPVCTFTRTPIGTQHTPQRLDRIETNNTTIYFDYLADRQDGRQMRLTGIRIYNKLSNTLIRRASFGHSYFGNSSGHTLRLRLDNVKIGGRSDAEIEKYNFTYNNTVGPGYYTTPGYVFPGGSFFPASIAEDYWGYLGPQGGLPSEYLGFLTPSQLSTYGGNRNPDPNNMQMCILQQLQYPTGGKTVFEFEPNRTNDPNFYGYPNQTNANSGIVGGLRVKSIKDYDNDDKLAAQRTFTYDIVGAAQKIQQSLFYYQQQYHYYKSIVHSDGSFGGIMWDYETFDHVCNSSSVFPLTPNSSSPVIYSQVTEYKGTINSNSGKVTYNYDIPPETTMESSNLLSAPKFISGFTLDRGIPNPLLVKKIEYKNLNGSYIPLNQLENQYTVYRNNEFITGIRVDWAKIFVDVSGYWSSDNPDPVLYDYLNSYNWEATKGYENVSLLGTTINTDYSHPTTPVVTTTIFDYGNLDHLQPTQKTITSSKGETWITQYKYPHEYAALNQQPYALMVNDLHIWDPVIEKSIYKNNISNFIQSDHTTYNIWNGNNNQVYPRSVETKKGTENYQERVNYNSYDDHGNITNLSKAGGPPTSYLYGYNKQYPVAEVKNAQVNDVYLANEEESTDFPVGGVFQDATRSHSGWYSGRIDNGSGSENVYHSNTWLQVNNYAAKNYHYSGWVYSNGPSVDIFLFMKRAGEGGYFSYVDAVTTSVTGKWVHIEKDFLVPADVTQISLRVDNNGSTNGQMQSIWFDDLRIHPTDAQMTSYTYDPLIGVTSSTDAKGQAIKYEYDSFQRLMNVKDQDGNIKTHYCYNYAGQQVDCTVPSVPAGPPTTQSNIFVRVEVSNVTYEYTGSGPYQQAGNQDEHADVYIRFYSDAACTQPYTLTGSTDADIQQDYNYSSNTSGSGQNTNINTYSVTSGSSEMYLGNFTVRSSRTYDDPYFGTVQEEYSFVYTLISRNGSNYTPLDTNGFY